MTLIPDHILAQAEAQINKALHSSGLLPHIESFFDENTNTASYVVHDPATMRAAIIDSVREYEPASGRTSFSSANKIIAYVEESGLTIDWILETHAHADHLSAAPYLKEKLGGQIAIGREIIAVQNVFGEIFNLGPDFVRDGSDFDQIFEDGEQLQIGNIPVLAMHVPGHTPADLAYVIGGSVFTGDTLFMPDYGTARADFPGGNARQLYRSIRRLLSLPDITPLYLCHDYKAPNRDYFKWETTVGEQRQSNVHVHDGVSEDEFVKMRTERDATLDLPTLIIPSVQINMRAGHLPPAESNGVHYLKTPLDQL